MELAEACNKVGPRIQQLCEDTSDPEKLSLKAAACNAKGYSAQPEKVREGPSWGASRGSANLLSPWTLTSGFSRTAVFVQSPCPTQHPWTECQGFPVLIFQSVLS